MRKPCHGHYVSSSTAAAAVTAVLLNCVIVTATNTPRPTTDRPLAAVYLTRGMTDRIDCPAKAKPPSTLIVWSVNNHVIDTTSSDRLSVDERGALTVNNVTNDDAGLYTCTQYSPVSDRHPTFNLNVLVRGTHTHTHTLSLSLSAYLFTRRVDANDDGVVIISGCRSVY